MPRLFLQTTLPQSAEPHSKSIWFLKSVCRNASAVLRKIGQVGNKLMKLHTVLTWNKNIFLEPSARKNLELES